MSAMESDSELIAQVRGRIRRELPHYGSTDLEPLQLAEVYARLIAVSVARAEFLGELLAAQYEEEGVGGLVGSTLSAAVVAHGGDSSSLETVATGEAARALIELEMAERAHAAKLTKDAIQLGVEASRVDLMRSYGRTVAEVTRQFAHELRLPWSDEATRRVAQRAVLRARHVLGFGTRLPETVGPALSTEERGRLLELMGAQRAEGESDG